MNLIQISVRLPKYVTGKSPFYALDWQCQRWMLFKKNHLNQFFKQTNWNTCSHRTKPNVKFAYSSKLYGKIDSLPSIYTFSMLKSINPFEITYSTMVCFIKTLIFTFFFHYLMWPTPWLSCLDTAWTWWACRDCVVKQVSRFYYTSITHRQCYYQMYWLFNTKRECFSS